MVCHNVDGGPWQYAHHQDLRRWTPRCRLAALVTKTLAVEARPRGQVRSVKCLPMSSVANQRTRPAPSRTWTPERRKAAADQARRVRPWEHSTGPRTAEGKARSARNSPHYGERELWLRLRDWYRECRRCRRERVPLPRCPLTRAEQRKAAAWERRQLRRGLRRFLRMQAAMETQGQAHS